MIDLDEAQRLGDAIAVARHTMSDDECDVVAADFARYAVIHWDEILAELRDLRFKAELHPLNIREARADLDIALAELHDLRVLTVSHECAAANMQAERDAALNALGVLYYDPYCHRAWSTGKTTALEVLKKHGRAK